jgi:hypothetical protein
LIGRAFNLRLPGCHGPVVSWSAPRAELNPYVDAEADSRPYSALGRDRSRSPPRGVRPCGDEGRRNGRPMRGRTASQARGDNGRDETVKRNPNGCARRARRLRTEPSAAHKLPDDHWQHLAAAPSAAAYPADRAFRRGRIGHGGSYTRGARRLLRD